MTSAHSLQLTFLDRLRFSGAEVSAMTALGAFRGKQGLFERRVPEVLESLKQLALIESAESSNRIEGITAPRERVEALIARPTVPANRSEREIAGYRDALNLIHESASEMVLSVNVVLQLHGLVYRYLEGTGGRWKMADNEIVERNADGTIRRVRFRATPAVATPGAMSDLVNLHAHAVDGEREPLVLIPLTVLDFLCVHPFTDGNGRVARLLTLLLLYRAGFAVGRFISLERVIEESKETYYEALAASSAGWHEGNHDPHPWMNYFWGILTAAHKEFEQRVSTVADAPGAKTALVEQAVRRRRFKPFAISDIETECPGVSRDMVRHVLRQMKERGEVTVAGRGPGARWKYTDQ